MTDWLDFAEIREKVSLKQVLLEYYGITNLKSRGNNKLIGPCPVHGGDSPRAFHAELNKNLWHCFTGCKGGGNQLDLVMRKDGVGIREAAMRLHRYFLAPNSSAEVNDHPKASNRQTATEDYSGQTSMSSLNEATKRDNGGGPDRKGGQPKVGTKASSAEHVDPPSDNPPLEIRLNLLPDHPHLTQTRGLESETISHFGLGYCSRGILRGCIAIPIYDEVGTLVAYAGRRLKPSVIREKGKYHLPKGFHKDLVLYNYHLAKSHMEKRGLIVVEGFFTVFKLFEVGFPNVVAVMGSSLSEAQAELLAEAREVILLFDGDESGNMGAEAARERLRDKTQTRLIRLPEGTEPDDLSPREQRWLINGITSLDFSEITIHRESNEDMSGNPESAGAGRQT